MTSQIFESERQSCFDVHVVFGPDAVEDGDTTLCWAHSIPVRIALGTTSTVVAGRGRANCRAVMTGALGMTLAVSWRVVAARVLLSLLVAQHDRRSDCGPGCRFRGPCLNECRRCSLSEQDHEIM